MKVLTQEYQNDLIERLSWLYRYLEACEPLKGKNDMFMGAIERHGTHLDTIVEVINLLSDPFQLNTYYDPFYEMLQPLSE